MSDEDGVAARSGRRGSAPTLRADTPVLLWVAGPDGLCTFFDGNWLRFTGRTLEQELGEGWAEGVHPQDFQGCMHSYLTAFVERRSFAIEYRLRRADGQYRWLYDHGVPRFEGGNRFVGYVGSCVDITDRHEAQDALQRINDELEARVRRRTVELESRVREREVLVREVHHRVKNNLQLVSSLLSMQARQLDSSPLRSALAECQGRVQSIALLHEQLYNGHDLSRVPLSSYTRSLAARVTQASSLPADQIELAIVADEVLLPVDRAIPCGLIINELLTNAYKHAFPERRRGGVRVVLQETAGGRVRLEVADDGVGLPPSLEPRSAQTMGLNLVATLVEQLSGDLEVDRARGTAFNVTFPIEG